MAIEKASPITCVIAMLRYQIFTVGIVLNTLTLGNTAI